MSNIVGTHFVCSLGNTKALKEVISRLNPSWSKTKVRNHLALVRRDNVAAARLAAAAFVEHEIRNGNVPVIEESTKTGKSVMRFEKAEDKAASNKSKEAALSKEVEEQPEQAVKPIEAQIPLPTQPQQITAPEQPEKSIETSAPPNDAHILNDEPAVLTPFSTIEGRNWMAKRVLDPKEQNYKAPILLLGDGPFEARELAEFLHSFDMSVYLEHLSPPDNSSDETWEGWRSFESIYTPVVVLGEKSFASRGFLSLFISKAVRDHGSTPPSVFRYWIERVAEDNGRCLYLRSRSLDKVTFISQEMLLAEIFTKGNGDFNFGAAWQKHSEKHPALKAVRELRKDINFLDEAFKWPKTQADPGETALGPTDWPQIGMLKFLGYSVGVNGETRTTRQRILSDLFHKVNLPKVDSQAYVDEWGTPESGSRLRKMAQSIAAFCRGARRRDEYAMSLAIEEWEEDLSWLKTTYYDGKFDRQFQWPETIG